MNAMKVAITDYEYETISAERAVLEAAGIECVPELRGLGEYPAVASLLADAPFLPAESWNRNAEEKQ